MKSKTKAELIKEVENCETESSIIDISDFKFRLSLDGLLTPELEQFIHDYLKFHQEC